MPLHDWQFYIVTIIALAALLRVLWPHWRWRKSTGSDAGCSNCASGSASSRSKKKKVALTIDRRRM